MRFLVNGKRDVGILSGRVPRAALFAGIILQLPFASFAARTITLAWTPSDQPEVVGYSVYYGTASKVYDRAITVVTASATISGFVEGKTYYFAVSAIGRQGGESMPSAELAFTVPPVPAGIYTGLFSEAEGIRTSSAGALTVTVSAHGVYSGRIRIEGRQHTFSGSLLEDYRARSSIPRRGITGLMLDFKLGTGVDSDKLSGRVTDGFWTSFIQGDRGVFDARTRPAVYAGSYTFVLPGRDEPSLPAGAGFGTIRIKTSGAVQFAGVLADGTRITGGAPISKAGMWPLFVSPYSAGGLVMGWVNFPEKADSDLSGEVCWIKPPVPRAKFYAPGFSFASDATGALYVPPARAGDRVVDFTDGLVTFLGGNLGAGFRNVVSAGPKGYSSSSGPEVVLRLSASRGGFTGKAADPVTGRTWPFMGVVLQRANAGFGFLLGSNQTSRVEFGPAPRTTAP